MMDEASSATLLLCPFCSGTPTFSDVMEKDDRRYMQRDLECCVNMSATIGWGSYKSMTDEEIKADLTASLVREWNTRVAAPANSADIAEAVLEAAAKVCDEAINRWGYENVRICAEDIRAIDKQAIIDTVSGIC